MKIEAFTPEELADAMVIDSEGYIYGYFEGIEVAEDDVFIKVYEKKMQKKREVDRDKLLEKILEKNAKGFLGRKKPEKIIDEIRKVLGLTEKKELSVEDLLEYIKVKGYRLEIPLKEKISEKKYTKGKVSIKEVKGVWIGKAPLPDGQKTVKIKIILLNTPREAKYRGMPDGARPTYRPLEALKEKMVIGPHGRLLGYVKNFVIGAGIVGLRLSLPSVSKKGVNVRAFANDLKEYPEYSQYADKLLSWLKENHSIHSEDHVEYTALNYLSEWMTREGFPKEIVKSIYNYVEEIAVFPGVDTIVTWDKIEKIGDVILLGN